MIPAILIPLIGSLLILLLGKKACHYITVTTSLSLVVALVFYSIIGSYEEIKLSILLPQLRLSFYPSEEGFIFAYMVSILWCIANIYAIGYMKSSNTPNIQRFFFFFTIAISFTLGIAFANNLVTIFLFYELLTLSTYPLITHSGTIQAKKAGRTYLAYLLGGSIFFFFPAIIITSNILTEGGFHSIRAIPYLTNDSICTILFVMFIYGVTKAALMPMHRWLTAAMVAPTPVSALLHAVAVVKSGVFIIIKTNFYLFGKEWVHNQLWLIYAASVTIILGSIYALKANNLKERLAYSTISQLSYIILLATVADSIILPITYMILHAFAKITLFFAAGAIYIKTKNQSIDKLHGIGKAMPLTMCCFTIAACSMIGLPFTGIFWGKAMLLLSAMKSIKPIFIIIVVVISTMLNTLYFVPIIYNAFWQGPDRKYNEINLCMIIPMIIVTLFTLMGFWVYLI